MINKYFRVEEVVVENDRKANAGKDTEKSASLLVQNKFTVEFYYNCAFMV